MDSTFHLATESSKGTSSRDGNGLKSQTISLLLLSTKLKTLICIYITVFRSYHTFKTKQKVEIGVIGATAFDIMCVLFFQTKI